MVTAFQIIILIILFMSFFFAIDVKKEKDLRTNATAICIAGMGSFILSTVFL